MSAVHVSWAAVAQGALVAWPPVLAGLWWNRRRARAHLDRVTSGQTDDIREIAAALARELRREDPPAPPAV